MKQDRFKLRVLNEMDEKEEQHPEIELLYVLEGFMEVDKEETISHMKENDVLLINTNEKHQLRGSKDILYMQIMISYNWVSEMSRSIDVNFECDSTKDASDRYNELRKFLRILLKHYLETHGDTMNFGHIALCSRVMESLSMYFCVKENLTDKEENKDKFENRIVQINNYIQENYNQPISLKDIADKLYLSNGYLSRFFKQNYGMNFIEYLTNIRLFHSVDELLYTNTPITKIATDSGFATVSIFNKAFKKKYGETPSEMRKRAENQKEKREKKEEQQNPEIEKRLKKYFEVEDIPSEKLRTPNGAEIEYSVIESEKIKNFWGNTINVGAASELLRSEVQEHITFLKQAFGFQYIRIWDILSSKLLIDLDDINENYNFVRIDLVFDFLINLGLKPHIEFGMKSDGMQYNLKNIPEYEETGKENKNAVNSDLSKIERFLEAFMQHLIFRYGRSEVDTWRMEIGCDENETKPESFEIYLTRFAMIYNIVKKYSAGMLVGGCGLRLDSDEQKREGFLKKWNESKCRPDFVSAYIYPYEERKTDSYVNRSRDNEYVLHKVIQLKNLLAKIGMDDIRVFISEWNFTASFRNYLNDCCFSGAYIIKNILDIYGKVDDIAHFVVTDRTQQDYDSNELLFGGAGILSKDGILKPSGYAFEFLNRLYPYYIGHGKNYFISTDQYDSYGIVCHNQRKLGDNYYLVDEDKLEKEHLWIYFNEHDEMELTFNLKDMSEGDYQIKVYRINEKNGSAMFIWRELNYEKRLSREDVKYFRRVCEPRLEIYTKKTEKNTMNLEIKLMANEIAFIRVQKIS